VSGCTYVGSSADLSNRFSQYYSKKHLDRVLSKGNSIIYSSILKYGYSNFSLQILEYCTPDVLLEREQYYIDLLKPSYNIYQVAGSPLGFKHSLATLEKLRIHGYKHSERLRELGKRLKDDPI
jgi:group I intron endonuclease